MKYLKPILVTLAIGTVVDIVVDMLVPDRVMNAVFIITMSIVVFAALLVIYGTITKNRWGINFEPVNCPRCGHPMPKVRKPTSHTQALWGGGTCGSCGCEVDKWGREISAAVR
jgi:hypothetical protein